MSKNAKHVAPREKRTRAKTEQEFDWINESESGESSSPKKGNKGLVIAIIILAVIAVLLAAAFIIFNHLYSRLNYDAGVATPTSANVEEALVLSNEEEEPLPEGAVNATDQEISDMQAMIQEQLARMGGSRMSSEDVINILLVGTDARTRSERARSDVMILASLNKKTHHIVLSSFMRDIYTYMPNSSYGSYNRLNAAYVTSAGCLIDTLEQDFGVEINNYVAVNFYDFANIIDKLGGVDVELTNKEVDFINEQAYWGEQAQLGVGTGASWLEYSDSGLYHLNGTQALAHCRNRSSAGSDYDRTERQRTVIATLLKEAKDLPLDSLYALLDEVLPMVTTDLTQGDCLSLLLSSEEYLGYDVDTLRIPAADYSDAYINGMAVLSIDFSSNAKVLQDAIYGATN